MEGWIKLYRKFCEWEWYKVSEMVHLFIHILLSANREPGEWRGIKINRGQLITGRNSLSDSTGISQQTIRTCLNRLKSTSEITIKSTNKYSIITIIKYEDYQNINGVTNQQINQLPNKQLTSNQPATNHKQEIQEGKELKKKEDKIDFSVFWNLYNHKIGNKPGAEKKWNKLTLSEQKKIIEVLPVYLTTIKDKQFQAHADTWLNQRRWENEDLLKSMKPVKPITAYNPQNSPVMREINGH